jgi:hypothetical protein
LSKAAGSKREEIGITRKAQSSLSSCPKRFVIFWQVCYIISIIGRREFLNGERRVGFFRGREKTGLSRRRSGKERR